MHAAIRFLDGADNSALKFPFGAAGMKARAFWSQFLSVMSAHIITPGILTIDHCRPHIGRTETQPAPGEDAK